MASEPPIVVILNRLLNSSDKTAIKRLKVKWLVYDVKIVSRGGNTEIKFFYSPGAKNDLVQELGKLFVDAKMTGM